VTTPTILVLVTQCEHRYTVVGFKVTVPGLSIPPTALPCTARPQAPCPSLLGAEKMWYTATRMSGNRAVRGGGEGGGGTAPGSHTSARASPAAASCSWSSRSRASNLGQGGGGGAAAREGGMTRSRGEKAAGQAACCTEGRVKPTGKSTERVCESESGTLCYCSVVAGQRLTACLGTFPCSLFLYTDIVPGCPPPPPKNQPILITPGGPHLCLV
jgi:hypothetical protein